MLNARLIRAEEALRIVNLRDNDGSVIFNGNSFPSSFVLVMP